MRVTWKPPEIAEFDFITPTIRHSVELPADAFQARGPRLSYW